MVVLPSFLLGRVVAPAGRADNTATSLVTTGSYQWCMAAPATLADENAAVVRVTST
jgi:hypothetical protein